MMWFGRDKGLLGEKMARKYLQKKGYRLLEKRYRINGGEVDLIMKDGDCFVFVEVKYRPDGETGEGLAAVDFGKEKRIIRAADTYMYRRKLEGQMRYDIVEITSEGTVHIENAFADYDPRRDRPRR